jgi:hypothetical protein
MSNSIERVTITANDKRRSSCQKVGGEEKKKGHQRESDLEKRWGTASKISYKPEADKVITDDVFLGLLRDKLGYIKCGNTSIKGGKSIQFVLGKITELSSSTNKLDQMINNQEQILKKYLGKYESEKPAGILAYKGVKHWIFFRMEDVITFIVKNCKWRLLDTGRLKGDFEDKTSKLGKRAILTFEHRNGKHNSDFIGASGGQGIFLIQILRQNICFHEELI